jgi:hypothetical protein
MEYGTECPEMAPTPTAALPQSLLSLEVQWWGRQSEEGSDYQSREDDILIPGEIYFLVRNSYKQLIGWSAWILH